MKKQKSIILLALIFVLFSCEKNTAPTCEITSPADNSVFVKGEIVTISVAADDADDNLKEVRFYIDNAGVGSASSFPFSYTWNTTNANEGSHTIKATAIDEEGEESSDNISVVLGAEPGAAFTANQTNVETGTNINFTDQSTGNPTSWNWDFGDGSTSTEQNPVYAYTNAGTYTVSLTVSNEFGSNTQTKINYINIGATPIAEFSATPTEITEVMNVVFTNESLNTPTSWNWDFGDGSSSTEQNPIHVYNNAGTYTVELTVSNQYGSDNIVKTNYIIVGITENWSHDTETEIVEVTNPVTGKVWMDRNLGASQVATSSTDENAYGDLYQWGRAADGHQLRTSDTTSILSNSDTPGHDSFIIADYFGYNNWRDPSNPNLWNGLNGINNPCPNGFRLPTQDEWAEEIETWDSQDTEGAFNSVLKLTLAGYRTCTDGHTGNVELWGYYWSSNNAHAIIFSNDDFFNPQEAQANGYTIRCIKD